MQKDTIRNYENAKDNTNNIFAISQFRINLE